jgi:V8-like Glu-specific endopeptidase
MRILALLLVSNITWASIFYNDDRLDFHQISDEKIRDISRSIPALIQKSKLKQAATGYQISTKTLHQGYKFCSDANFAHEYQLANCSASLIAPDLILTAAHCLDKDPKSDYHPSKYVIVFDYKKTSLENKDFLPKEDVYEIENEMPFFIFNWDSMLDVAILKLKRKVTNRRPLKINLNHNYSKSTPLFILGYPLGVSQKLTADSNIISNDAVANSFRHHLDTFSVNSGSAVFDASTNEIIGVHVRGTVGNYQKYGRECNDWRIGNPASDYGEANMLAPIKKEILEILNEK